MVSLAFCHRDNTQKIFIIWCPSHNFMTNLGLPSIPRRHNFGTYIDGNYGGSRSHMTDDGQCH